MTLIYSRDQQIIFISADFFSNAEPFNVVRYFLVSLWMPSQIMISNKLDFQLPKTFPLNKFK